MVARIRVERDHALTISEKLKIEEVQNCLGTSFLNDHFHYYDEVSSTNEVAKTLGAEGSSHGCIIIAETQKKGRGRLGRTWHSPKGGLWFSIILRPEINLFDAPKLTMVAAVAISKAIHEVFGINVVIKWPNDILINGKKVCGILTESVSKGEQLDFVVLGIGLNVNNCFTGLPTDIRRKATSLKEELGSNIDRIKLLCNCLQWLEKFYKMFERMKFKKIIEEWRKYAKFLGKVVEVDVSNERIRGRAIDIDDFGALLIEQSDGTIVRLLSGSIINQDERARLKYKKFLNSQILI